MHRSIKDVQADHSGCQTDAGQYGIDTSNLRNFAEYFLYWTEKIK